MFERIRRKAKVRNMTDERNEKLEGRTDGAAFEEAAEKLDKFDVDEVSGGAGKQSGDKPPELPEIM